MSSDDERYTARLENIRRHLANDGVGSIWVPASGDATYLFGIPLPRPPWGMRDPVTKHARDGILIGPDVAIAFLSTSVWARGARTALRHRSDVEVLGVDALGRAASGRALSLPPHATLECRAELVSAGARVAREAYDRIGELRSIKSSWEIEQLRQAQAICVAGLAAAVGSTRAGMSVLDFHNTLIDALFSLGAEAICSGPEIQVSGPTVHLPFGVASPQRLAAAMLEPGAVMTLNFGCMKAGYLSDIGRTVFVGDPDSRALAALDAARSAQRAGVAALAAGGTGAAVSSAVRTALEESGHRDGMWPKAGHGIGIEHHELPINDGSSDERYRIGMAATVEVGLWPDTGQAAYCEDVIVCSDDGATWLSRPDHVLTVR